MAEFKRLSTQEVDFVIQNAQGSLAQAHSIADNFHAHQKIKAIFALGTPALQAAARAEKEKPIFFTAVTDPVSLGIIHPGTNICGTTDQVDTEAQAALILKLLPAIKTIAIVYNPAENNSQVLVKKMQASLHKKGLENVTIGVHTEAEIAQAIGTASRKGEAILLPNDNLLSGSISLVAKEAIKKRTPLFVSDISLVAKGALVGTGAEYVDLAKATAEMAHQVLLLGKSPEEMGIQDPLHTKTVINHGVAEELGISHAE